MIERYAKRRPVAVAECSQCEYLGLHVGNTLTVFSDGSTACGLCGYREHNGMPVPSTVKVITKRGSTDT